MNSITAELLRFAGIVLVPAVAVMAVIVWQIQRRQNPPEMDWKRQRKDEEKRQNRRRERRRDRDSS